jgi:hypothetical protein
MSTGISDYFFNLSAIPEIARTPPNRLPNGRFCPSVSLKPMPFFSRYVHDKRGGPGKVDNYPPELDFSAGLLDNFKLFFR